MVELDRPRRLIAILVTYNFCSPPKVPHYRKTLTSIFFLAKALTPDFLFISALALQNHFRSTSFTAFPSPYLTYPISRATGWLPRTPNDTTA